MQFDLPSTHHNNDDQNITNHSQLINNKYQQQRNHLIYKDKDDQIGSAPNRESSCSRVAQQSELQNKEKDQQNNKNIGRSQQIDKASSNLESMAVRCQDVFPPKQQLLSRIIKQKFIKPTTQTLPKLHSTLNQQQSKSSIFQKLSQRIKKVSETRKKQLQQKLQQQQYSQNNSNIQPIPPNQIPIQLSTHSQSQLISTNWQITQQISNTLSQIKACLTYYKFQQQSKYIYMAVLKNKQKQMTSNQINKYTQTQKYPEQWNYQYHKNKLIKQIESRKNYHNLLQKLLNKLLKQATTKSIVRYLLNNFLQINIDNILIQLQNQQNQYKQQIFEILQKQLTKNDIKMFLINYLPTNISQLVKQLCEQKIYETFKQTILQISVQQLNQVIQILQKDNKGLREQIRGREFRKRSRLQLQSGLYDEYDYMIKSSLLGRKTDYIGGYKKTLKSSEDKINKNSDPKNCFNSNLQNNNNNQNEQKQQKINNFMNAPKNILNLNKKMRDKQSPATTTTTMNIK